MLRIAICDDDKNVCVVLDNILKEITPLRKYGFETEFFHSGEALYKSIQISEYDFDIIFLDIELASQMNGVYVGNAIRRKFLKESVKIVYISSYESYAMQLFKVRPFDFVKKPLCYEKIEQTVLDIMRIIEQQTEFFFYEIGDEIHKIELYKILYFKSNHRKLTIMTYDNNLKNNTFNAQISYIGEKLAKSDFFFIHRSYLVNYHNVAEYKSTRITLINGQSLDITRKFQSTVKEIYLKKIGETNDKFNLE